MAIFGHIKLVSDVEIVFAKIYMAKTGHIENQMQFIDLEVNKPTKMGLRNFIWPFSVISNFEHLFYN